MKAGKLLADTGSSISKWFLPLPVTLFIIFLAGLVFNWRAVSSISMGVLCVMGLMKFRSLNLHDLPRPLFLLSCACLLFFLSKIVSLLYTNDIDESMAHLRKSLPLALAPFCFYVHYDIIFIHGQRVRKIFAVMLITAFAFCFLFACARYFSGADISVFFYHELAAALGHHAIQLSMMVLIALIGLNESKISLSDKTRMIFNLVMISFLVLLSSKLVISFFCIYAIYLLLKKPGKVMSPAIVFPGTIVIIVLILLTPNPLEKRFWEMFSGNSQLFRTENFHQGIYFNGLQFRLVQYRFTGELLNENKSWFVGLSTGDAQKKLDEKYRSTGMYTGKDNQSGYLGYHTHNQFLQTLLQQGYTGLVFYIFFCVQLIILLWHKKNFTSKLICVLLMAWCFTDAVLETQYGIALFICLPFMMWLLETNTLSKKIPSRHPVKAITGGNPVPA